MANRRKSISDVPVGRDEAIVILERLGSLSDSRDQSPRYCMMNQYRLFPAPVRLEAVAKVRLGVPCLSVKLPIIGLTHGVQHHDKADA